MASRNNNTSPKKKSARAKTGTSISRRLYAVTVCILCVAALVLCLVAAGAMTGITPPGLGSLPGFGLSQTPEQASLTPVTTTLTIPSVRETNIHATVTVPEETDPDTEMPLVVMCHGFTGNRDGDGHFQPLADTLAKSGIASIRVDFAGNGESEEPFTSYTLTSIYDDIESAISYMRDSYTIGKIGLVGHSMGGRAVSLHLSDAITAAALWSPANGNGLDGLEFIDHSPEGREQLRADAAETGEYTISGWSTPSSPDSVTISSEFVEEMDTSHPLNYIRDYSGALLVAFAGGDPDLLSQTTIDDTMQAAKDRGTDFVSLYGQFDDATHNYTAQSGDEAETAEISASLEGQTADFLIAALLPDQAD